MMNYLLQGLCGEDARVHIVGL